MNNHPTESTLFNVSTRAWITLMVVTTVCIMALKRIEISEPMYSLVGLIIGFYFGQRDKPKTQI